MLYKRNQRLRSKTGEEIEWLALSADQTAAGYLRKEALKSGEQPRETGDK